MWNKKIIVTNHAKQRFEQRNICFSKHETDTIRQILYDLKPLNVRKRELLHNTTYKVTTKQGKVYIILENKKACFVKTVYKTNLQYETVLKHIGKREINKYFKNGGKKYGNFKN